MQLFAASHLLILPFPILIAALALHWLSTSRQANAMQCRNSNSSVICCVGERERGTFVCKTCRGRSIHPFQKNNITFKWKSLEPPNPIFEPRSLSRTFPFWIFHSEEEEGSTSGGVHISLGITLRPFDQELMQELP